MPQARGFTLIEILIVMVIISVVSSLAVLTITSNQHKELERIAKKLSHLITLAEQQAMLQPATIGIGIRKTGYQFYELQENNTWSELNHAPLVSQSLPDNVQLTLKMHNKAQPLNGKPTIVVSASGDITPFAVYVAKKGHPPLYQVKGDGNGKIASEVLSD